MIKTQSAKAKGRKLQQWVRNVILELIHTLEPDDVKSTSMGAGGEDVQLSPAAREQYRKRGLNERRRRQKPKHNPSSKFG